MRGGMAGDKAGQVGRALCVMLSNFRLCRGEPLRHPEKGK